MTSPAHRQRSPWMVKTPSVIAFPAILTFVDAAFSRANYIVASMQRSVVGQDAPVALIHARQHFLKRDTVFLHVLVYSECVHFDSRVHAAIKSSLHRRATWPRK